MVGENTEVLLVLRTFTPVFRKSHCQLPPKMNTVQSLPIQSAKDPLSVTNVILGLSSGFCP